MVGIEALKQCDQMTRLFVKFLAIYNNEILPNNNMPRLKITDAFKDAIESDVFLKMGKSRLLFWLFLVFSNKQYNFYNK